MAIAPPPAAAATVSTTLVRTILLSSLSPPSPDPAGVAWDVAASRFIVSDSEVEEMSIYQDANLYELTLAGSLTDGGDITTGIQTPDPLPNVSNEPTGTSFDPGNGYLFISDDGANKVTTLAPGSDGNFGTPDDVVVASLNTSVIGSTDSEDVAYDTSSGDLFIVDGAGREVYRVSPGPNGLFDGIGDTTSHFDTAQFGSQVSEGLGYDPARDSLLVVDPSSKKIYESTKSGTLLNTIDLAAVNPKHAEDVVLAPAFANPGQMNYYLVARGVDNDSNPNENDGKMYEISVSLAPLGNQAPIVNAGPNQIVTLPNGVSLAGSVTDDGLPSGQPLTSLWTQHSGPGGGASFADETSPTTTVTFSTAGTYVLRLTGDDTELQGTDDLTVTVNPEGAVVLDIPIVASPDDAEEAASGSVARGSNILELAYKTSSQTVGLRFANVSIPQGAAILSAYVQFETKKTDSSNVTLTISGQDAGNPGTFTNAAFDISNRTPTDALAMWTPDPWTILNERGPKQRTPDLSEVIQQIVARSDWADNALVLIITGDGTTGRRRADAFNGGTAPALHIEYTTS